MTDGTKATKNLTFRFNEEDFQVQLEVTLKDEKVVSVSDSTQAFINYLKELHLLSSSLETCKWLNSSKEISLSSFSNSKNSFRVRTKARRLGLTIILGESFQQRREASMRRAFQTGRCL